MTARGFVDGDRRNWESYALSGDNEQTMVDLRLAGNQRALEREEDDQA